MKKSNCLAMILAGGRGSRLGVLTKDLAKPGMLLGGKYRIIDFPLSNCRNSGIHTVGILTQYQPLELNWYVGNGSAWNLDSDDGAPSFCRLIKLMAAVTGIGELRTPFIRT